MIKIGIMLLMTTLGCLALTPQEVVVIYNTESPESQEVAEYYQQKRAVPEGNVIGISFPHKATLTQVQYEEVVDVLQKTLSERGLWELDESGVIRSRKFLSFALMYEVPFRVRGTPIPATVDKSGKVVPERRRKQFERDEASFDSELTLIGQAPYKVEGAINNPVFNLAGSVKAESKMSLVGRIDGPSKELCIRLIDDAIAVEKTGLYGKAYLDLALKGKGYALGDDWIKAIYNRNIQLGIPSVIEQSKDVFVTKYPLLDAAFYFGWYSRHQSGALKGPLVKLKKGSIAVHIHSFSAADIRNAGRNWVGPLLTNGAAATLGNVYEPYLSGCANLSVFYQKLSEGKTLVECAWCASPVLSWQNLVVGDPLYRPFMNRKPKSAVDKQYEYLRGVAPLSNGKSLEEIAQKAEKEKTALYYEVLGLVLSLSSDKGLEFFGKSSAIAENPDQILINTLHEVDFYRRNADQGRALELIEKGIQKHQGTPQAKPFLALKNILAPPPPPPVNDATKPPRK